MKKLVILMVLVLMFTFSSCIILDFIGIPNLEGSYDLYWLEGGTWVRAIGVDFTISNQVLGNFDIAETEAGFVNRGTGTVDKDGKVTLTFDTGLSYSGTYNNGEILYNEIAAKHVKK